MIYAKNADALSYRGIHPNLDLALEHITPEFLARVGYERVELNGSDVYATRFTYETVPEEESFFEAHKKYTPTGGRPATGWPCRPGTFWRFFPTMPTGSRCALAGRRK